MRLSIEGKAELGWWEPLDRRWGVDGSVGEEKTFSFLKWREGGKAEEKSHAFSLPHLFALLYSGSGSSRCCTQTPGSSHWCHDFLISLPSARRTSLFICKFTFFTHYFCLSGDNWQLQGKSPGPSQWEACWSKTSSSFLTLELKTIYHF